jgi:hypothetical protein
MVVFSFARLVFYCGLDNNTKFTILCSAATLESPSVDSHWVSLLSLRTTMTRGGWVGCLGIWAYLKEGTDVVSKKAFELLTHVVPLKSQVTSDISEEKRNKSIYVTKRDRPQYMSSENL